MPKLNTIKVEINAIAIVEAAVAQTRADLATGKVVRESAEAHLVRIKSSPEIIPVNDDD
ncbi:MAG: hypothetical protein KBA96_12115 [Rhodocyclaceae bacterium]|nr:hypothetical protein [Rhodocyclaceae bacterium]MBP7081850.1 hypothetical protein [Rhodocyclaceae bacterium]